MSKKPNEAAPFHVEASRADLLRAVSRAGTAVERRNTIPILSFVELAVGFGTLAVTGTNLDHEIRVEIEARGEGAACLPAHRLRDLLRALPGERVALTGNADGVVTLASDTTEATYGSLPATDFPRLGMGDRLWALTLPDGVFAFLIGGAAEAMSTEDTRYYLNGVCLEVKNGTAVATGTDGHRLISRTANLSDTIADIPPTIIPREAVKLALAQIGHGEAVLTGFGPSKAPRALHAEITGGGARLRTKIIDGTFPDWRRVVPQEDGTVLSLDVSDFRQALRIARANASDRGRAIKLDASDQGVRIVSHNPDCGTLTTAIPGPQPTGLPPFGCNVEYLTGFVDAAARIGSKTIRLHVTGPGNPIKILPDAAIAGALAVLMPMRV